MTEKEYLARLSHEEAMLKLYWNDILKRIHKDKKRDLAYLWTDEVRRDFKGIEKESKKIEKIVESFLEKLSTHYKQDEKKYEKELSDVEQLLHNLNKIEAKEEWIKLIHDNLQEVISDIESDIKASEKDQLNYLVRGLYEFSNLIAGKSHEQAKRQILQIIDYITLYKNQLEIKIIEKEREGIQFNVPISEFWWGIDLMKNKLEYTPSMIDYCLNKLSEICSYLDIDVSKVGKLLKKKRSWNKDISHKETIKSRKKIIKDQKFTIPKEKVKRVSYVGYTAVKSALSFLMSPARPLAALLMPLLPSALRERVLIETMNLKRLYQVPAILPPNFFNTILPTIMEHYQLSNHERPSFSRFIAFDQFEHFNAYKDFFYRQKNPKLREYYHSGTGNLNIDGSKELEYVLRYFDLYVMNLPIKPKTKLVPIPSPLDNEGNILIPFLASGRLFYDNIGRLYLSENNYPETTLRFLVAKKEDFNLMLKSAKIKKIMNQNASYFYPSNPGLDKELISQNVKLSEPIEKEIRKWRLIKNDREKVVAVQKYVKDNFFYGGGFKVRLGISKSPGETIVEKNSNYKEGVCYDINKIGYVILQKLGIPCIMCTGFKGGDSLDKLSRQRKFGAKEGEIYIKESYKKGLGVKSGEGHAILKYYDFGTKIWNVVDMTPSKKRMNEREKKEIEREREKIALGTSKLRGELEMPSYFTKITDYNEQHKKKLANIFYYWVSNNYPVDQSTITLSKEMAYSEGRLIRNTPYLFLFRFGYGVNPLPTIEIQYISNEEDLHDSIENYSKAGPIIYDFITELGKVADFILERLNARVEEYLHKTNVELRNSLGIRLGRDFDPEHEFKHTFSTYSSYPKDKLKKLITRWLCHCYIPAPRFSPIRYELKKRMFSIDIKKEFAEKMGSAYLKNIKNTAKGNTKESIIIYTPSEEETRAILLYELQEWKETALIMIDALDITNLIERDIIKKQQAAFEGIEKRDALWNWKLGKMRVKDVHKSEEEYLENKERNRKFVA